MFPQRRNRSELTTQSPLVLGGEPEVLCTSEDQSPISSSDRKVDVETILRSHHVREGSHTLLCRRCVDDRLELVITQEVTLLEAESVPQDLGCE